MVKKKNGRHNYKYVYLFICKLNSKRKKKQLNKNLY